MEIGWRTPARVLRGRIVADLQPISTEPPSRACAMPTTSEVRAQRLARTGGFTMTKNRTYLLALGGTAAVGALGMLLGPAGQAQAESAIVTIGQLEAQGFDVKIDRIGTAPLAQCVVTSVRNPRNQTQLVEIDRSRGRDILVPIVVNRTITVSLNCTR